MVRIRTYRENNHILIDKKILQSRNLSLEAKGLYCTILACPDEQNEILNNPSNQFFIDELIDAKILEVVNE